jgi:hypothetical protein
MWSTWCGLTLIFGFFFRTGCHVVQLENSATPALQRQNQHGRASSSSSLSWPKFSLAQSASFSLEQAFRLRRSRWLVPPRPSVRSWRCVGRTRAGPIPCCQIMASWRKEYSQPPQLPASGFRRCFNSAAWLPARSSFRPKARLLRRFHRAGQQPTPRGTASGAQLPPPRSARLNGAQPLPVSESIRRAAHHWHCRIPLVPRRPAPVRANPRPGPACVTAPIPPPTWRQ